MYLTRTIKTTQPRENGELNIPISAKEFHLLHF